MLESVAHHKSPLARMLRPSRRLALASLLSLAAAQVMAMGFGPLSNGTALGQTLSFTVGVRLDPGETLDADCVSAEVLSGENRLPQANLKLTVVDGSAAGERLVRISSTTPIDEPVVSMTLHIACGGRLARKFVAFIDPPMINLAQTAAPAGSAVPAASPAPVVRQAAAAGPTTVAAPARPAGPTKARRTAAKPAPRPRAAAPATASAGVVAAAEASSGQPRTVRKVRLAKDAPAGEGSRLEIGPAAGDSSAPPTTLRLASALAMPPAPAISGAASTASDAATSQGDAERQKLVELERSLATLRAEAQAAQASLAQVQARLREAEAQREANNFALSIAALAAVLAAVVGFALWRRSEARRNAKHWWAPPTGIGATAAAEGTQSTGEGDWAAAPEPRPWSTDAAPAVETTASPRMLMPAEAAPPLVEPDHEMSVEELIDLEQQAEFFVVLGQDEAAIDLLMGHLRSSGGASPLPYLKLLEIYRRRGEREAYERIRERFNRRFNAYAQEWDSDPQQGRTLARLSRGDRQGLQILWATPQRRCRRSRTLAVPARCAAARPSTCRPIANCCCCIRWRATCRSATRACGCRPAAADRLDRPVVDATADPRCSRRRPPRMRLVRALDAGRRGHHAASTPGPTDDEPSDPRHVIDFGVTTSGTAGFDTGPAARRAADAGRRPRSESAQPLQRQRQRLVLLGEAEARRCAARSRRGRTPTAESPPRRPRASAIGRSRARSRR